MASALAAVLSACGVSQEATAPTNQPAPTSEQSATTSPATDKTAESGKPKPGRDQRILSTSGIGPYQIGARADALRKAGLLGKTTPVDQANCPDLYTVEATGAYAGTLQLVLRHNVLVEIGTAGGEAVQASGGGKLGMSFDEVKKLYGTRGSSRTDSLGNPGFLVPDGNKVLLFGAHPIRPGVGWVAAGLKDQTQHTFDTGTSC